MLGWVVTFLIVALIAGILGFGGVAGASIEIAKIIFFIAVVLFLVSALVGVGRGRRAAAETGARFHAVGAGLPPPIHVFVAAEKKDVDARDKRGHDELK